MHSSSARRRPLIERWGEITMHGDRDLPEPFLDWYGIWPGCVGFDDDRRAWASNRPQGLKLSVQEAEKTAPILVRDRPWEETSLNYANVLYEDGRYRLWYATHAKAPRRSYTCYAESEDGFEWKKPDLGLHEHDGSTANNIVRPEGLSGVVFRDPSACESERYKLVTMEGWTEYKGKRIYGADDMEHIKRELEAQGVSEAEMWTSALDLKGAVQGAVSPDGLHWTPIEEPLFEHFCDTHNVALYDEEKGKYVGYWRAGFGGRRCIGRSETDDFRHWPPLQFVSQPDLQFAPTEDLYTNAYSLYPGGGYNLEFLVNHHVGRYHVMFPSVYHRDRDVLDLYLAVSRDGLRWNWPERKPIVPLGKTGSRDCGGIYAGPGLLPIGDDEWGLLCWGTDALHNDSQAAGDDAYYWARWKRDRLVALEAEAEGSATLLPRECTADELRLNCETGRSGWIRVQLIVPALQPAVKQPPIEGYGFADCTPLTGDCLAAEVKWKDGRGIGSLKGRKVCVQIEMCQAKLYSISM